MSLSFPFYAHQVSNPSHHLIEVDRLEIQGIREAVYLPSYGFLFLFIFFFLYLPFPVRSHEVTIKLILN